MGELGIGIIILVIVLGLVIGVLSIIIRLIKGLLKKLKPKSYKIKKSFQFENSEDETHSIQKFEDETHSVTNKAQLIECAVCNTKISCRATICPNCGTPRLGKCVVCNHEMFIDIEICPKCGDIDPFYNKFYSELSRYTFLIGEKDVSSIKISLIREMIDNGKINSNTLAYKKGTMTSYKPISSIPELNELLNKSISSINCFNCENLLSERATVCPKCGLERKEKCNICGEKILVESSQCPLCGDPDPFPKRIKSQYFGK